MIVVKVVARDLRRSTLKRMVQITAPKWQSITPPLTGHQFPREVVLRVGLI